MSTSAPQERVKRRSPVNPYIGPKPFTADMRLPARDRESRELTQMLAAERIVLLHAPSGAGKTSLVQAGLPPQMKRRRFAPTRPVRVNAPPPAGHPKANRYVHSVACSLLANRPDIIGTTQLSELTLSQIVEFALPRSDGSGKPVLVLDQFEEVLTLDPSDWTGQEEFFLQLGTMLDQTGVWALMSMREDYMGGLHRYARLVPGHLRARYRLDFLTHEAAVRAVQEPAADQGVPVADDAAEAVVRKLSEAAAQRSGAQWGHQRAPYVEPVQLQVVCRRLWQAVREKRGDFFPTIEATDVEDLVDVPGALRKYYARAVSKVASRTGAEERVLRDWIESTLIVGRRFRGQSSVVPTPDDPDPGSVVRALEDAYLIRADRRANTTWYELSHDALVEPVLESNRLWREEHLPAWKRAAMLWHETRNPKLLLRGVQLRQAHRESHGKLSGPERAFLAASDDASQVESRVAATKRLAANYAVIATIEAVVILALMVVLFVKVLL
jgi:hypothetical protein